LPILDTWTFKNQICIISISRYEYDIRTEYGWGSVSLYSNPDNHSLEECAWKVVERITEASRNYTFSYDTLAVTGQRALLVSSYMISGDPELNPRYSRYATPYVFQHNGIVYALEFPTRAIGLGGVTPFEVSPEIVEEMIESFYVE
jgi:hypothetical protein